MSTTTVRVTRTTPEFLRGEVTPVREAAEALAAALSGEPLPDAVRIERGDQFDLFDRDDRTGRALYLTDLDDDDRHIVLTVGPDGLVNGAEFSSGCLTVAA